MTESPPPPSEPAPPRPVSEPAPVSGPASARPSKPGKPRAGGGAAAVEKSRPWWLLIVVAVLATPPVVVICMNLPGMDFPEVRDDLKVRVNAPAGLDEGGRKKRINPAGIQKLREMITSGRACMNPWTILTVSREQRHRDRVSIDPKTGKPIPNFEAEAWALIMVPAPGFPGSYDVYRFRLNGTVAYVDGPDGDQVLVMPFTAKEFHATLAEYMTKTDPAPPTTAPE